MHVNKYMYIKNYKYRIESVNGQDISWLFKKPFDFEQEMLCIWIEFVVMGNYYNDYHPFCILGHKC